MESRFDEMMLDYLDMINLRFAALHNRPVVEKTYPEFGRFKSFISSEIQLAVQKREGETEEKNLTLLKWALSEDTGLSSKHLCAHMIGVEPNYYSAPRDGGDRGRCVGILKLMPEWIERLPEMKKYKDWAEQIPLILSLLTPPK